MSRQRRVWQYCAGLLAAVVVIGVAVQMRRAALEEPANGRAQGFALQSLLGPGAGADGFSRATAPRAFQFPDDHGAHPDYQTEWWYLSGRLRAGEQKFGFQLTLFRYALAPPGEPSSSEWRTNQLYMAHLAVTDVSGGRHVVEQRIERGALGLAGADAQPFRAYLHDWSMRSLARGFFPLRVNADSADVGIWLELDSLKSPVLQGEQGLSRKGPEPGNASYYYAYTRLSAAGSLRIDEEVHEVKGEAWLDREWGTSSLGGSLAGWDWFGLQLEDGRELMLYQLRRNDGGASPFSAGSLISASGETLSLGVEQFQLEPLRYWVSPATGIGYPVAWHVEVPAHGLDLTIEALLDDQEMRTSVNYWEGAVAVRSRADAVSLGGGYLELTGYPAGR